MSESDHRLWRSNKQYWQGDRSIHRSVPSRKHEGNKPKVGRQPEQKNEPIKFLDLDAIRSSPYYIDTIAPEPEEIKESDSEDEKKRKKKQKELRKKYEKLLIAKLLTPSSSDYLINNRNDIGFYFKLGNLKLSGRIIMWKIAAPETCNPYCSYAKILTDNKKDKDKTESCQQYCYGINSQRRYAGARMQSLNNKQVAMSEYFVPNMCDAFDKLIKKRLKKGPYLPSDFIVRIHEVGEFGTFKSAFFDTSDVDKNNIYVQDWIKIAHYLDKEYGITCQFYTKNPYVEMQNIDRSWPDSTKIWYSMGGSEKKSQPIIHDFNIPLNRANVLKLDARAIKCGVTNSRGVDIREQFDRHGELYAYRSYNDENVEIILPEDVDSVPPKDRMYICLGSILKKDRNTKLLDQINVDDDEEIITKEWYVCGYDCNYCFTQPNNTNRMVAFPQK